MKELWVFDVNVTIELDQEATWADAAYALNRAAAQLFTDAAALGVNAFSPLAHMVEHPEQEVILSEHDVERTDLHVRVCTVEIARAQLNPVGMNGV